MEPEIFKKLQEILTGDFAILGIGNAIRGDDGFGTLLAQRLSEKFRNTRLSTRIFIGGLAPENMMGKIAKINPEKLLILDAVVFGGKPGTTKIFSAEELSSPFTMTHGPTNFSMMKLFLPNTEISVLAVRPKSVKLKDEMSDEVKSSLEEIFKIIGEILLKVK
ncbi:hydrogenase maturation protease [bacterium]|nr:hydrogenase maturation protease [bacterium]